MVAAIRRRPLDRRGPGAAAPVLLDTRAQVPTHGEIAASGRGEESRNRAHRDFRPRPNSWTVTAQKASTRAQKAVARAFEDTGNEMAAARVELCGVPWVGFSPAGELLRSKAGVPTAILTRCGSQLCARGCAGDLSRRRRRVVMERVAELMRRADPRRPSPLFMRQPRDGVTTEEYLEAFAKHASAVEKRRLERRWDEPADTRAIAWSSEDDEADEEEFDDDVPGMQMPAPKKRTRRPRLPRRPRRDRLYEIRNVLQTNAPMSIDMPHMAAVAVEVGHVRRTRDSFRMTLPPSTHAYGCRQITLTQPNRADETLRESIARIADALDRFAASAVFRAHCDAWLLRIEFELSTPARRREQAKAEGRKDYVKRGTWWHVHVHGVVWGTFWSQSPSTGCDTTRDDCLCTRCSGVDDEDSLLVTWRRALVETKRYGDELDGLGINQRELLNRIRVHAHPKRRTFAVPLTTGGDDGRGVTIGGARIQIPARAHGSRSLSPLGAVSECIKYATKTVELGKAPRARVAEVVDALRGRRLMRCGGLLFGLHLPEDAIDEPARSDVEGIDDGEGVGEHALTPSGGVVDTDEIVWRGDDRAIEVRRAAWEALHNAHEEHRRARAQGPPPDAGGEAWTP